ncbi:MAG TPA: helix-turn-helix transcriptional regulator [Candidatus Angelobacter sp.]
MADKRNVPQNSKFFKNFGQRVRKLRKQRGFSQEDMISFGFSARHWQQIEAGRPITVTTVLRICEAFHVSIGQLVTGLDQGIYQRPKQSERNGPGRPISAKRSG